MNNNLHSRLTIYFYLYSYYLIYDNNMVRASIFAVKHTEFCFNSQNYLDEIFINEYKVLLSADKLIGKDKRECLIDSLLMFNYDISFLENSLTSELEGYLHKRKHVNTW